LVNDFIKVFINFLLNFSTKRQPNIVKNIRAYTNADRTKWPFFLIFTSWHCPFKAVVSRDE
jgi:hypothetical protein